MARMYRAVSVGKGKRSTLAGCIVLPLFFGIFLAAGSFVVYIGTIQPMWKTVRARSWVETDCVITASELAVHDGDDGDTYSVDIKYDYVYDGTKYQGHRYDFTTGSSSGTKRKRQILAQFPVGAERQCYVNPQRPDDSVLNRGITRGMFVGLFGLLFVAVGLGGIIGTVMASLRARRTAPAVAAAGAPVETYDDEPEDAAISDFSDRPRSEVSGGDEPEAITTETLLSSIAAGPIELKPTSSPLAAAIGLLIVAVIWNGVISIFVAEVVGGFLRGDPEWFTAFFLIPFLLVGLGTIWGAFYYFLACWNPRPILRLGAGMLPLGSGVDFAWEFQGATNRIRRLRIRLIGRELATYTRGTSTVTDKQEFLAVSVLDSTDPTEIAGGVGELLVPATTMHSFDAPNNKIVWVISVAGEIMFWPDVSFEFPVQVMPLAG